MRKVFVKGLLHKRSAYFPRMRNTSTSKVAELDYVPLTTPDGDETLMVKEVADQPRGHYIYTTPSPRKESVYDFVESERSRSRSPIKSPPTYGIGSPVAGPSWRSPVRQTGNSRRNGQSAERHVTHPVTHSVEASIGIVTTQSRQRVGGYRRERRGYSAQAEDCCRKATGSRRHSRKSITHLIISDPS